MKRAAGVRVFHLYGKPYADAKQPNWVGCGGNARDHRRDRRRCLSCSQIRRIAGRVEKPHNKIVLITGGSRGLGLAMAREFGRAGCRIAICARDARELRAAKDLISPDAREVAVFECDVAKPADAAALIKK